MTTILADVSRRCMVADSLMTVGGLCSHIIKVEKINGCLVGTAGSVSVAEEWVGRYRAGAPLDVDTGEETMEAMVLMATGELLYFVGKHPVQITDPAYAIGSGAMAALAAYKAQELAGLTPNPVIAVEAAIAVDVGSGGMVRTFTLDEPAARPANTRKRKP